MTRKRHAPGAYKAHIKKGDTVLVRSGKSADHKGRVTAVLPRTERAIVEGANIVTRHQRARGGQTVSAEQQSGRIEKPAPIHVSNLMVVCPQCNRPTRVGYRREAGKPAVRVCKQEGCGEPIDREK